MKMLLIFHSEYNDGKEKINAEEAELLEGL